MPLSVLVFDDQRAVVEALQVLFEVHRIPMAAATTQEEVLRQVAEGDVGVLIQDMNFSPHETSGREGIELFRRARQADADLPILLITAWASLETAVQLVKEGASDYLEKPWDDDRLVTTIRNLLEIRRLKLENRRLQEGRRRERAALAERHDLCDLVYESEAMYRVLTVALNVADSVAPVLLSGPSGSGKEKIAEIIRANSPRRGRAFVRVNLGAIPENLMESELFGAEPGAYTGLRQLHVGRFEAADAGTLFLDEIDSLSLAGQVKLLRVLQSGEYQRLGSSATRAADVRVISATNADLKSAIRDGRFREDLYYRLNVIELNVPPLSQRPEDILPLARHFLERAAREKDAPPPILSPGAEQALRGHAWPGNVRELENRVRRAVLVGARDRVGPGELDLTDAAASPLRASPEGAVGEESGERQLIEEALLRADGMVSRAAEELGLSRQALYRKMARLGIVLERRPRA
jgi:DNA-binding NtrC family response regulator